VNGTEFVAGATINLDGKPISTNFVSSTQLTAVISFGDTHPGIPTYKVTVVNPSGAVSNSADLTITFMV
jgi:hypothetical protein